MTRGCGRGALSKLEENELGEHLVALNRFDVSTNELIWGDPAAVPERLGIRRLERRHSR